MNVVIQSDNCYSKQRQSSKSEIDQFQTVTGILSKRFQVYMVEGVESITEPKLFAFFDQTEANL